LSESGFDPLARTTRFMLTEEAHHMFVGETAVQRVVQRTCELMKRDGGEDVRTLGGIDLPTIQKYVNLWYSVSADLFGGEVSTNAANYFGASLKGRSKETSHVDHLARDGVYRMLVPEAGALVEREVPLRNAMNEVLRDNYIEDCQRGCDRWNKVLERNSIDFRFYIPSRRFHRQVGIYAGCRFTPQGGLITTEAWTQERDQWLPTEADRQYVRGVMGPVHEPGKIANWIAPPDRGINGHPFEFEYVRFEHS
jgi:benzoyl-CoA 2,3-dioxygenase component B